MESWFVYVLKHLNYACKYMPGKSWDVFNARVLLMLIQVHIWMLVHFIWLSGRETKLVWNYKISCVDIYLISAVWSSYCEAVIINSTCCEMFLCCRKGNHDTTKENCSALRNVYYVGKCRPANFSKQYGSYCCWYKESLIG